MARVHGKYGRGIQNWWGYINMDFKELGLGGHELDSSEDHRLVGCDLL
jgi:hypothetical protein